MAEGKAEENQSSNRQGETFRVDTLDKVTGETKYIEDLPDLPGTVYAATLRSPYSHARILSIDSSKAEQHPGVVGVLDSKHLGDLNPKIKNGEQHFVTTDKARFDGDLLGIVGAVDLRTAREAVELINVEYEALPIIFNAGESLDPGTPLIHESLGTNLALEDSLEWGDVEKGFNEADRIFEEVYFSPSVFHHPIEPLVTIIANWNNDAFDVWVPTNTPCSLAVGISEFFEVDISRVRVRVPYIGGGFGAKDYSASMFVALALSRKIARPVKLVATEEESFRYTSRCSLEFKAKMGVKNDGTLVALDVDLLMDTGAYFNEATHPIARNATGSAWGAYRFPHFRCRTSTVYTNKVPAYFFRNTGKNETFFGIECMVDSVARQIGMDPVEFRAKNALHRGEFTTRRYKERGEDRTTDFPAIDADLAELMETAAKAIGWGRGASTQRSGAPSSVARGRGISLCLRRGSSPFGTATAMASLGRDGTVTIHQNAAELGMGTHTMISIVSSETLGIPQRQVQVTMPDSSNDLEFVGVNSQRTTVQMGTAVQEASENLKQEILKAAAKTRGGRAEDWRVMDGMVCGGEARFSFADIAGSLPNDVPLKGMGICKFDRPKDRREPDAHSFSAGQYSYWAPGASAAEVEVDRETGEVRVLQYAMVSDAGKILHYGSAAGQMEGGAVMGFGPALFEELHYRDGQLQNADAFQYRLPLASDIPESFHTVIKESGGGPGPFGSKGVAQTTIGGVAPAIGNAIFDAVGVRIMSVPFSPEKILRALGKLGEEK